MTGLVELGFDYPSVLAMPWTDARRFLTAGAKIRGARLKEMAIAVRVANLEGKDWKKWIES